MRHSKKNVLLAEEGNPPVYLTIAYIAQVQHVFNSSLKSINGCQIVLGKFGLIWFGLGMSPNRRDIPKRMSVLVEEENPPNYRTIAYIAQVQHVFNSSLKSINGCQIVLGKFGLIWFGLGMSPNRWDIPKRMSVLVEEENPPNYRTIAYIAQVRHVFNSPLKLIICC